MNIICEMLVISMLTAVACALPGVFLVLRGVALMSDAISHAILMGIALMFLWVHSLHSTVLFLGAVCAGIVTVLCIEGIIKTRCLKKDAAIGIIFPLFFSIGILLISKYARSVHLDLDMVLLGDLAYAPFNRFMYGSYDLGPIACWTMGGIVLINSIFIALFYKELKLCLFDEAYAQFLGFSVSSVYYGLMVLTSLTAVGAFDVVGSIVVVALMIAPASTAYLLSKQLSHIIYLSSILGCITAFLGYVMAAVCDISIAGSIATMGGVIFFIVLFCTHNGRIAYQNIK